MAAAQGSDSMALNIKLADDTIRVYRARLDQGLEISFRCTIRVPDNQSASFLPPDLGKFPLFPTSKYASNLPAEMAAKGGFFFPMYQREAMWIDFEHCSPFAVKIYVGGVNAISGEPALEDRNTKVRRLKRLQKGLSNQDYVVVPKQKWLDGIAAEPGMVRQFVAMPTDSGYSVEAQITGQDRMCGIQFEITPQLLGNPRPLGPTEEYYPIVIKTLTGKIIELIVYGGQTVLETKEMFCQKEGIPPDQQRLIKHGQQLEDFPRLEQYGIEAGTLLHMVLRLRGGGVPPPEEPQMTIATGGLIKQAVAQDRSGFWDPERTLVFNVQILNSASFKHATGLLPPPTPVSAKTYAAAGLPFFKLYEEESLVAGDFKGVKSVSLIGKGTHDEEYSRAEEESHDFPLVLINPEGPKTPFKSIFELTKSLKKSALD